MIELGNSYTLYKSIDNIYLTDDEGRILRPDSVINKFTSFERDYHDSQEAYTLTKNGLIAEFSSEHAYINIDLDFRQSFDYDDKGRTYIIYREKILDYEQYDKHRAASEAMSKHEKNNQVIIVEYSKYKDNGLKDLDKRYYLVIYGIDDAYEIVDRWERRDYCYDASRNSRSEFYVYKAFRILCKKGMKLFFAFAESKEHAIGKLVDVIFNVPMIKNVQENYIEKLEHKSSISELSDDARGMGYVNCLNSLDGLSVHFQLNHKKLFGIWAGLPWFFQFWARDELLCIRSLILESKFDIAKEILFRHLNEINSDGRLTNIFPASGLGSADAIGWLFKRIEDYIKYLNDNKILGDYLSLYDLKYIRERLRFSIKQLQANYIKEGLMHNIALETWMDTSYKDAGYETDTREGSRIEIQALYLNMLKLMNRLDA